MGRQTLGDLQLLDDPNRGDVSLAKREVKLITHKRNECHVKPRRALHSVWSFKSN